ncbi:Phosphoribosylglycinamide formyltransferase [Paenibacillus pasadenensis]|uniref:Phosphoribosylglycinamide formyltransferase n=1 Tax=Paenibacillus pasadenensis TaxID=217090 RepID=A0A2N5NBG7_9BACL|nr:phosphoribosylglycinamide formyltransferase [Paenibacillus pasadenensis]PLT47678.1 Phosphoribosylglycinamide formyltransferase [Paenibacillus pasadenensis]
MAEQLRFDLGDGDRTGGQLRVAVFASGQGSNFQALADAAADGKLGGSIELLVCDRASAPVVERARRAGIDAWVFDSSAYASREAYEGEILAELQRRGVGLVVLAGYMRILTPVLVDAYAGRMINIHPSLLPAFPGMHAIRQALNYGVKVTGVTIHFVDGGLDSGPIIAQRALEIGEGESEASLAERIHAAENALYPWAVRGFAEGRISLDGRRALVSAGAGAGADDDSADK